MKDPNLVVVSWGKEFYVIVKNKINYQNKLRKMSNIGMHKGTYKEKKKRHWIT